MRRFWNRFEIQALNSRHRFDSADSIAKDLGRTREAIYHAVKRYVKTRHRRAWTEEEEDVVRDRYKAEGKFPLSAELGRTAVAIQTRANRLGVHRVGPYKPKTRRIANEELPPELRKTRTQKHAKRLVSDK